MNNDRANIILVAFIMFLFTGAVWALGSYLDENLAQSRMLDKKYIAEAKRVISSAKTPDDLRIFKKDKEFESPVCRKKYSQIRHLAIDKAIKLHAHDWSFDKGQVVFVKSKPSMSGIIVDRYIQFDEANWQCLPTYKVRFYDPATMKSQRLESTLFADAVVTSTNKRLFAIQDLSEFELFAKQE